MSESKRNLWSTDGTDIIQEITLMNCLPAVVLSIIAFTGGPEVETVPLGADAPSAQTVLLKLREGRDQIRSGCFRARGRLVKADRVALDEERKLEGDVEIFSAFDIDRGLIRFDRTEPVVRKVPNPGAVIGHDRFYDQEVAEYIRTPQFAMTWVKPWSFNDFGMMTQVGIYPPTIKNPTYFSPFDARSIGICLWHEFKEGRSFEKTFDIWTQDRWVTVEAEPDGILHLVLDRAASGQSGPLHLWIDEKRGHSPIRLHCQDAATGGRRPEPPWFESRT
jgi:hypothetical protein